MIPTNYVLGFIFTEDMQRALLVKKARPAWQAGKMNGIGGHVEPKESVESAMDREAEEEAGITPGSLSWHLFGEMSFSLNGARVFLFSATDPGFYESLCSPTPDQETEPVVWVDWTISENWDLMLPNLSWLIPMALNRETGREERQYTIQC